MRFALMIEPQQGVTWPQQVSLAHRAEDAGFGTLYRADHYESFPGPAGGHTTDGWASIAGLVMETRRLRHGTLVSPVTFRHPANVAKVVATIDEMSGGRVELGLGAAWHVDEHRRHGMGFPPLAVRLEMLEEQLQVVAGLWSAQPGWSFSGQHYHVEDARYGPPPVQQPRPPLIVGTKGTARAVRMAARWADHLNLYYCTPDRARAVFEQLDAECAAVGRPPTDVVRSVLLGTVIGEGRAEADRRRAAILRTFDYAGSVDDWLRENEGIWISGTPDEAVGLVQAFGAAGAELVVLQDFLPHDLPMIDLFGALTAEWSAGSQARSA